MAKDVFSHAFAQSATNRDRAVATFGKAYKKAASKDTDPYGLLRAALRWGSAQAAAAPPVQKPMDAARARVKALLTQPPQENANAANARELVHGLLHKEQYISKPPRRILPSCRGGFFCFPVLSRLRGAVALFAAWVGVCKGGVATRLRRRERGFSSGTVIPCPFLLRSRDNNSTDCRTASSHTYPSYRRVRRTRNTQTTQPIFLSAILSFEPIARALSVQHQPLAHFRYPALYNTAFHYGSILRSTCPHQSVSLSAPPYIRAPQFGQMG